MKRKGRVLRVLQREGGCCRREGRERRTEGGYGW